MTQYIVIYHGGEEKYEHDCSVIGCYVSKLEAKRAVKTMVYESNLRGQRIDPTKIWEIYKGRS